ncbi:MAG TPA: hypothetical protein VFW40_14150 [Capsulimonadaceae bacterium]|nr:hypothetical protein [Capsulimonadaceae bacterium]
MADQLEIAHRTPGRTRLRWRGDGAPSSQLLLAIEQSPSIRQVDYRSATGSLVLLHEPSYRLEHMAGEVEKLGISLREKSTPSPRPRRPRPSANGSNHALVLTGEPASVAPEPGAAGARAKWAPIVADIEAVVLLGLILGWIRDWMAGRNLAFGTVVLVVLSAITLFQFWWRRQRKKDAAEPDLEFIFA